MDVKSAYLYGKLDDGEVIHMRPPPDYQVEGLKEGQVLRLRRALYGLKQAGRRWYQVLVAILDKAGMKVSNYDRGLFIRHNRDGTFTALTSHVDDLTITSPSDDQINNLMETIGRYVEWTGGDSATWLLGIQISRDFDRCEIKLRQLHYIETILTRYGFQDIKTAPSPMDPNLKLSEDQGPKNPEEEEEMAKRPYAAAVGALRYLADMTRPDLAYAVGQLARYLLNPGFTHWTALKRVFQYLQSTKEHWLVLGGNEGQELVGYSDADGMSTEGRRAISGYVFQFHGTISWSSKRQELVSLSTAEAEYIAIVHACKEAIWINNVILELLRTEPRPLEIYCDNQSAIALAKTEGFNPRTKHIDIRYHWIREKVQSGELITPFVPTDDQLADILTKALMPVEVKHFVEKLGLRVCGGV